MLARLKMFLDGTKEAAHGQDELRLASAVLLVEAATLDGSLDAAEDAAIRRLLAQHFKLDAEAIGQLLEEAREVQGRAAGLVRYTRVIKDRFSQDERIDMVEMLWDVVYADGVLHDYEANLMRRIGGLLYVPDREIGEARRRVLKRLGVAP